MMGRRDSIVHRRTIERNERNYVSRAHAGMDALMRREIDQLGGLPCPTHGRLNDHIRGPSECHHAAIMIAVRFPTEHQNPRGLGNRIRDRVNDCGIPPLGKIRNTLEHFYKITSPYDHKERLHLDARRHWTECCPRQASARARKPASGSVRGASPWTATRSRLRTPGSTPSINASRSTASRCALPGRS